jgi:hypothetical protein
VFSVTVFTALLGSGFQRCSDLGFRVQRHLPSLAGTFPLQLPSWTSFQFLGVGWDWVHLVRRPLVGLLYQPRMIHDKCGVVCGMRMDKGNRSTRRKPAPAPLCPPQIPHDLTRAWTLAAAVGSRRITAWAMARPTAELPHKSKSKLCYDRRSVGQSVLE